MARIVIVGASLAGIRAAQALRTGKFDGTITVVDPQPHQPYDKPPLSKRLLAGTMELDQISLVRPDQRDELALDLRLGAAATGLDVAGHRLETTDGSLDYDALVIATGSAARRIPGWPEIPGLHVLRSLDDALALRADLREGGRLVVVGGGFIGLEAAATAVGMGVSVTVIEPLTAPLVRGLGERMGMVMAGLHTQRGVDVRLSMGVSAPIVRDGRVVGVRLTDGTELEADAVLVGIGASPATGWLDGSGLELNDGVVTDANLQAADGVWAAGDVCRWDHAGTSTRIEHWTNASDQGMHAGDNILAGLDGAAQKPFTTVPFVWSDQFESKIQVLGRLSGDDDIEVVAGSLDDHKFVAVYGQGGRLTGALGVSMPRVLMTFRRLLMAGASMDEARAAVPT